VEQHSIFGIPSLHSNLLTAVSQTYQAVLLAGFGGPNSAEEIRPFLARVTRGAAIPPERLEEVAHHYEAVGGKSPLNEITFRQAEALQGLLRARGAPLPVYVGLRNSSPFFAEALGRMARDGVTRALGFILSSHRTEASWERYQRDIAAARAELGDAAPAVDYCKPWYDHPLFIQTWTELIQTVIAKLPPVESDAAPLVFTAHSVPVSMAGGSPYVEQLHASASMIAAALGRATWSLAYQSRSGKPSDPWLEPDIGATLRELAGRGRAAVIVAPIGFVSDHVEVLYDLDVEAARLADKLRLRMVRASCPNDHPTFVRMIAEILEAKMKHERAETR
jgi:ferrochelatase